MSILKTAMLLAALTALFVGIGFLIGGKAGMVLAFLLAVGMNFFAYWNSADMVLNTYGAREVSAETAPEFYGLVRDLARRAGLPMPRVYIIDTDQPNAFATGRDPEHAAVAATTGLLAMLSREEVAGVIGHELGHVKNRDILLMTITATVAGAISMIANIGMLFGGGERDENAEGSGGLGFVGDLLLMILAPLAASLVQMAISRTREYEADRVGAEICGQPVWLADALVHIHQGAGHIANPVADGNPATAHLFIMNPLHAGALASLFSTHPATEERVRRLRAMVAGSGRTAGPGSSVPSARRASVPSAGRAGPRGPWG